jgi:FeS assembly protein IscX
LPAATKLLSEKGDAGRFFPFTSSAGLPMPMKWTDTHEIAAALCDAHGEIDPRQIRFTDLHRWVTELPDFDDDPQRSNEKILEALQAAWIDEL